MVRYIYTLIIWLMLVSPSFGAIKHNSSGAFADVTAVQYQSGSAFANVTPKAYSGDVWYALISYGPEYHFFVGRGQSNAVGVGDSTQSTPCLNGIEVTSTGTIISSITDPVGVDNGHFGAAASGSFYPAFANKYYELTGKKVIILSTAAGGSSLTATNYGHPAWNAVDGLGDQSDAIIHSTLTLLENNGYNFTFMGQLWYQGESDYGDRLSGYKSAMEAFCTAFNAEFEEYPEIKTYIFKIVSSPTLSGVNDLRDIQALLCTERSDMLMVFDNPYSYDYNLANYPATQGWHLTQEQYDNCGETAAQIIAESLE